MKKRILAVLLIMCFALTLGTVTVSASEASLQMEFSAPVLRVGTPATIIISAPEGAVSATALFSDNGKFVNKAKKAHKKLTEAKDDEILDNM